MTNANRAAADVHVLIAEDSPTQAERLKHALQGNGYRVTATINGRQALQAARACKPALIISDIVMPEMDGYQLCQQIKADPQLKDVPVILVTTLSDPHDVIRGLECRADNFVIKPYDEHYLLSRVQFALVNSEIRARDQGGMGIEIFFNGQRHLITADRLQILSLLLSTYEAAIQRNQELTSSKEDLRAANASLEATNNELEAFSYSVSHDLRSPLRAIDGFSQAVLDECAEKLDQNGKDLLLRVRRACQRMGQLIDDLLNLSRVARSDMRPEQVDLSAIANSIASDLQSTQPQRQATIRIAQGLTTSGDARLLRAALENLLGNAWKFTSKRSDATIEFASTQQDGQQVFYVRDNGAGFDTARAQKLFAPFQRMHSTEEFPGTGVGLATVQRIIHRHGGRIWAQSAPGAGATFYFTL